MIILVRESPILKFKRSLDSFSHEDPVYIVKYALNITLQMSYVIMFYIITDYSTLLYSTIWCTLRFFWLIKCTIQVLHKVTHYAYYEIA